MGLFRALAPRPVKKVRRAMNPVGMAKSAATPRVVGKARKAVNPVNAVQGNIERGINRGVWGQRTRGRGSGEGWVVFGMIVALAVAATYWYLAIPLGALILGGLLYVVLNREENEAPTTVTLVLILLAGSAVVGGLLGAFFT